MAFPGRLGKSCVCKAREKHCGSLENLMICQDAGVMGCRPGSKEMTYSSVYLSRGSWRKIRQATTVFLETIHRYIHQSFNQRTLIQNEEVTPCQESGDKRPPIVDRSLPFRSRLIRCCRLIHKTTRLSS